MRGTHPESDKDFARQMFVDFDDELAFWRDSYETSGFFRDGMEFRDFEPAIKLGINVFLRSHGRSFDELKDALADSYARTRGATPIEWSEASVAAAAAWQRMADKLATHISYHASREPGIPISRRPRQTASPLNPPTMP